MARKKVIKPLTISARPNGLGYALQEIKKNGERILIDEDTFYRPIMESLRVRTLFAMANESQRHYSVVVFKDENKFKNKGYFDKEVLNIETEVFSKDKVKAMSYINCLEFLFEDRQLLEKVEEVASDYFSKYNENGDFREMLDVGELRELYRSVKNADWEQYRAICFQFDLRANLYAKEIFDNDGEFA